MSLKYRIPITAITVFGTSGLLAFTVAIVLLLGFGQAVQSTRQLWANEAQGLIDQMEQSLDARLQPVRDQAHWVARDIKDLSDLEALDDYFYGVLAATPQVAGIAIITPTTWLVAGTAMNGSQLPRIGRKDPGYGTTSNRPKPTAQRPGATRFLPIRLAPRPCCTIFRCTMTRENLSAFSPRS